MMIGALLSCFKVKQSQSERNTKAEKHRCDHGGMRKQRAELSCVKNRTATTSSWQNVPEDIMAMILLKLNISDRMRLRLVCKSWNFVCMRRDIRSLPQLPWLVLPQTPDQESNKYLSFASLSDGKIHKFKLPKQDRGSWFCSSSRGWLIMIKELELDNSEIFLLNPISRTKHQLPPLKTIPYFREFVKTSGWKLFGALRFCKQVVLSSSDIDSESCTVAALFLTANGFTLGLCRPKDKAWSLFDHHTAALVDIVFSSGMLHALIMASRKKNAGKLVAPRPLKFGDNKNNVVQLKLVYCKKEEESEKESAIEVHLDHLLWRKGICSLHLLESNVNNEVLVMHQMLDFFVKRAALPNPNNNNHNGNEGHQDNHAENGEANEVILSVENGEGNEGQVNTNVENGEGNGDQEDEEEELEEAIDHRHMINELQEDYRRTSGFRVYKIDPNNDNLVRIHSLEDQALFFAEHGSCSIPVAGDFKGLEGCIHFATNNTKTSAFSCFATNTSRDIGVYHLESGRIERSFPSVYKSIWSHMSWFTPSL